MREFISTYFIPILSVWGIFCIFVLWMLWRIVHFLKGINASIAEIASKTQSKA